MKKIMENDMPPRWRSKWTIKKSKCQLFQTMVGCARGKEARNHGHVTISGEEFESGKNIRDDDDDDVEEVKNIDLSPHEVVNANSRKSPIPSIGGGTSYKRSNERKVNFEKQRMIF